MTLIPMLMVMVIAIIMMVRIMTMIAVNVFIVAIILTLGSHFCHFDMTIPVAKLIIGSIITS